MPPKRGTAGLSRACSTSMEDRLMQHGLSLDFWLWVGVAFNVALIVAACVRPVSIGG